VGVEVEGLGVEEGIGGCGGLGGDLGEAVAENGDGQASASSDSGKV
jgi:hypothetical protein